MPAEATRPGETLDNPLIPRCAEVRTRTQSRVGTAGNVRTPGASQGPSRNHTPTPENRFVESLAGSGSFRGHGQLPTSARGSGQLVGSSVSCGHSPPRARASGMPDGQQHFAAQQQYSSPSSAGGGTSRSSTHHLPSQIAKPRQTKAQSVREAEYVRLGRRRSMEDAPALPVNSVAVVGANRTADANKRGAAPPGTPSRQRPSVKGSGGAGTGGAAYPQPCGDGNAAPKAADTLLMPEQHASTRSSQRRPTLEFQLSRPPSQEVIKLNAEEVLGSLEAEYEEFDKIRSNSFSNTRGSGISPGIGVPTAASMEGNSSGELPSQSSLKLEATGGRPVMLTSALDAPARRGSSVEEDDTRDSGGSQELEDDAADEEGEEDDTRDSGGSQELEDDA